MTRLLALLGSGETAPTMIKPHRAIFERVGSGRAVLLDTPYGFQENADDISAKALTYFAESTGRRVEVASLRRSDADAVARESALAAVAESVWAFAGPGSPTYALRQWKGTALPDLLADKLATGGAVVFSSAAALTIGRFTVPVYEVYQAGDEPYWAEGLDVLEMPVAVVPHYDNAEGGHHDTRFCYLGERRLRMLEAELPADGWVLGIDEHTGLVVDLDADVATVVGNGTVTLRHDGASVVLAAGEEVAWSAMPSMALGAPPVAASAPVSVAATPVARGGGSELLESVRAAEAAFDDAVAARDAEGAVRAVLDLEEVLHGWAGDTSQTDAGDRGRAALRRMVVRLGALAEGGVRDPASVVGPFVEALLAERAEARSEKRFAAADRLRDVLIATGVEVRDTPAGTEWSLVVPEG